jgi:hypothetical protein
MRIEVPGVRRVDPILEAGELIGRLVGVVRRYSVSRPAMIRSSVDLPEPFRPRTPIFAPGRKLSEMSRSTCLSGGCVRDSLYIVNTYWLDMSVRG